MTPLFVTLAIVIAPALAAKISAAAIIVGTIGTIAQALLQKSWWPAKVKWALSWVWAIVGGVAAYIVTNGVPGEISVTSIQTLFAFVVGAYASIRLAYAALKEPLVKKIEETKGLGAGETPVGQPDPYELEDEDGFKSEVPDPYGDRP